MVLCLLNAVGWTDGGYDAIPTSADPNGGLTKRADSDEDAVVPPLTKRAGFANANANQISIIKTLISMWTDSGLDPNTRQVSHCHQVCAQCLKLCTACLWFTTAGSGSYSHVIISSI